MNDSIVWPTDRSSSLSRTNRQEEFFPRSLFQMDLELEIPIWYKGKVKWISNLSNRSTCADVIEAILSSLSIVDGENQYLIFECWRGVERPLKNRCRLLKLWNSWAGECENVTLTLRARDEHSIPTHVLIREQEKKLNLLKRQLKKTNEQIQLLNENEINHDQILIYLNLSRSILRLNEQIHKEDNSILHLTSQIDQEQTNLPWNCDELHQLLFDVNQTLIQSRRLTLLTDQLDQQILHINEQIEHKLLLLDDLELDHALQDNIQLDSLHDQPSSPIISVKTLTGSSFTSSSSNTFSRLVATRPTAIVEPSLSRYSSDNLPKKDLSIHLIPLSLSSTHRCPSTNHEESDTGISSTHSNDEPLITLV